MYKTLFLEYKFRDFTDEELTAPEANSVMAAFERLNRKRVKQIKKLGLEFGTSFVCTPTGNNCPLSPSSQEFCVSKLTKLIKLRPEVVWFDYLMFPGKWTVQKEGTWKIGVHEACEFCSGKDRKIEIRKLAEKYTSLLPGNIRCGYFSMPFKPGEFGGWDDKLGQDQNMLGDIFDYVSPMLYHRMIDKDTTYIHEHVKYLAGLDSKAKILPIIQLKDMPDDLEDGLKVDEIEKAINMAVKPPSVGVAIFSWDQAIEKGKLKGVSKILKEIDEK